ncbi:MAG: HEAT repeat domain-containing protein [Dehalococcoidia bacterium]|nr:MAG: HEAT repeat domain-containing protein [Dehalococcoidia bacterium]
MTKVSEKLVRALESDDACDLGRVIKEGKQEDFEALRSLLSLEPGIKPEHVNKAIYALGRWGDPAPVATIRSILPQLDEAGRISAIDALGRLGTKEALDGVLDHVDDSSPHVRKFVTRALGRINTPKAKAKLKEIEAKEKVDYVRATAAKYLRSE